ncbi:MAG TPA: hypothetical protein VMR75_00750 [Candidatus Saccharimonadales bacterium]|nr:hypothetical protein [Candidatus Saccharimonadales bacterium]
MWALIIAGILILLAGLSVAAGTTNRTNSLIGCLVVIAGVLCLVFGFYEDGQQNKTLPNLQSRVCEVHISLDYSRFERPGSDVQKLVKALGHNAKCEGTITAEYQYGPPIKIPLK